MIASALFLLTAELAGGWTTHGPSGEAFSSQVVAAGVAGRRVFAISFEFGGPGEAIYRSEDGGFHWERAGDLPPDDVVAFRADPVDPDRLFIATTRAGFAGFMTRLFRSDDEGATWTLRQTMDFPVAFCEIAIDPSDPHVVYVGYSGFPWVFQSLDGGGTFLAQRALPVPGGQLAVASDASVVAASGSDVFFSHDRAASWSPASSAPLQCPVRSLAIDPGDPRRWYVGTGQPNTSCGQVVRTDDGGATWTLASEVGGPVEDLVVDGDHPGVLYAAIGPAVPLGSGRVLASADRGQTWTDLDLSITGRGSLLAMGEEGRRLHAGTRGGVYERSLRLPKISPPPR